jgi:hypothetical protein
MISYKSIWTISAGRPPQAQHEVRSVPDDQRPRRIACVSARRIVLHGLFFAAPRFSPAPPHPSANVPHRTGRTLYPAHPHQRGDRRGPNSANSVPLAPSRSRAGRPGYGAGEAMALVRSPYAENVACLAHCVNLSQLPGKPAPLRLASQNTGDEHATWGTPPGRVLPRHGRAFSPALGHRAGRQPSPAATASRRPV